MRIAAHQSLDGTRSTGDALRRFLRLSVMDFRHGFGMFLVPLLIAAGCWYFLIGYAQPDVVLWGHASVQLSWSFAVIGPVGGAWGAWLAGRNRRTRTEAMMASTPVSSAVQDACSLVVPVAGALGVYTLIAMVMLGRTAMEATWGGPVWTVILYGGSLIAGYTVVGTVAGMIFPARLTPFIIAVGLFVFTTTGYTVLGFNSDYRYLAPFRWVAIPEQYDQLLYHARGDVPVTFAAAFGLVFGVMAVALAVLAFARHGRRSGVALGVVAAIILVPSMNAAVVRNEEMPSFVAPVSIVRGPSQYGAIENPPLVCAGEIVVTCVHQAFEGQLDEVASRVDAIVAPVAGLPGVPIRLEQRADLPSTDDVIRFAETWQWGDADFVIERVTVNALFPSPVLFDAGGYDSEYALTAVQGAIGLWLVRNAAGHGYVLHEIAGFESPFAGSGVPPSEQVMQDYWEELEQIQADINAASERFAMLSPEEQRSWLEANWDSLRAGELTLEDLP